MTRRWRGPMVVEGVQTGDGRLIVEGALTWIDPPLPLQPDHWADENVGTIEAVFRDGSAIWGEGTLDDGSEVGAEIVRKMTDGVAPLGNRWPLSVDLDDIVAQLVDTQPQQNDDDDDVVIIVASGPSEHVFAALRAAAITADAGDGDPLQPDAVVVDEFDSGRFVERVTQGRIRAVSMCNIQAMTSADENLTWMELTDVEAEPVAAAAPLAPPREWFCDPPAPEDPRRVLQRDGSAIVPMTILDDGRVFGHVAPPETCHIGIPDACRTVPKDVDLDGFFNLGMVRCADGSEVCTAPLLMGHDHAAVRGLDLQGARDHYANTMLQWADVRATWDQASRTVWLAGALRPNISDEQVRTLRGGGWSGDWRPVDGKLQMIAVQAVGSPGFGIRRAMAASAEVMFDAAGEVAAIVVTTPGVDVLPEVAAAGCSCGAALSQHGDTPGPHVVQIPLRELADLVASVKAIDLRTRHLNAPAAEALAASLDA